MTDYGATQERDRGHAPGAVSPAPGTGGTDASAVTPGVTTYPAAITGGEVGGRPSSLASDAWADLRRKPLFWLSASFILLMAVVAIRPQLFTSQDPYECDLLNSVKRPSSGHWFGYDIQGCDYYTIVIFGARPSISIGILVTIMSVIVALVLGALAGYYGGWVDTVVSRSADIFLGIPFLLGAIVFLNAFEKRGVWVVALALTVLGWMTLARLMRSSVIQARDMDYVSAARALGASDTRILVRHILPNAVTPLIVYATVTVGIIISAEATLSFLNVGLQLPAISWGLQIQDAQFRFESDPHLLLFPSLLLSLTVLSFMVLGDVVRDAFDPKLR